MPLKNVSGQSYEVIFRIFGTPSYVKIISYHPIIITCKLYYNIILALISKSSIVIFFGFFFKLCIFRKRSKVIQSSINLIPSYCFVKVVSAQFGLSTSLQSTFSRVYFPSCSLTIFIINQYSTSKYINCNVLTFFLQCWLANSCHLTLTMFTCPEMLLVSLEFYTHYSVIVSVCRGPCARGIYSTHGTPDPLNFIIYLR